MLRSASTRRVRPLLGTLVEISVPVGTLAQALDDAFAVVARVHRLMSHQDPSSELSRLNRDAHRAPVAVDPWTFDVFTAALDLFRDSDGVFDCTLEQGGSADIEAIAPCHVRYRRALHVNLDGIAKGHAVDRAVDALRDAGVPRGLVNAGGDLRVFGGWEQSVHLRLPQGFVAMGTVREGALATSEGISQGAHLASVFADSCTLADGLTKVVLQRGEQCAPILQRLGAEAVCREAGGTWQRINAGPG